MKVAAVLPEGRWGGPIKRTLILNSYFKDNGVEQILYLPHGKVDDISYKYLKECDVEHHEIEFDTLLRKSIGSTFRNIKNFHSSINQFSSCFCKNAIDVVHVNGPLTWSPILSARAVKLPVLTQFNDVAFGFPLNALASFFSKKFATSTVSSSAAVKLFYNLHKSGSIIHPPVEDLLGRDIPSAPTHYKSEYINICLLGNVNKLKGYHLLVESINDIRDIIKRNNAHFWIIGSIHKTQKEYHGDVLKKIKSYQLERNVHFLGAISDPWPYLWHASGIVSSAISEAWSMSIAEAVFAGKPIVAFDAGGVPEVLSGIEYSCLVPNYSISELSSAINELISNYSNIRHNVPSHYLEKISPLNIANEWVSVYRKAISHYSD